MIRQNYLFVIFLTLTTHFLAVDNVSSSSRSPIYNNYILMKFADLSNYYEELRSQQNPPTVSKLSLYDKTSICVKIFGLRRAVDAEEVECQTILRRDNPTIFEQLFREEKAPKRVLSVLKAFGSRRRFVYENSSKPRTFLVNGREHEENTFVCTVRNSSEKLGLDVYFVSDFSYNVNDARDGETFSGRFVFIGNEIFALAEESPLHFFSYKTNVNVAYTQNRNGYKIGIVKERILFSPGKLACLEKIVTQAEKWENDPVCKLDRGRKFRLCMYVCAQLSPECEGQVVVQKPCAEGKFTMNEKFYSEWMLTCRIQYILIPTLERTEELFVSRSYTDNGIFVFARKEEELYLKFFLCRIGVVVDKADHEQTSLEIKVWKNSPRLVEGDQFLGDENISKITEVPRCNGIYRYCLYSTNF